MAQVGTQTNSPEYFNRTKRIYGSIEIEYYYFNGLEWKLETETIGDNTPDWYIDTTDSMGHKFRQHRFDFPRILIPYIVAYHSQYLNDAPLKGTNNNSELGNGSPDVAWNGTGLGNGSPDVAWNGTGLGNGSPDVAWNGIGLDNTGSNSGGTTLPSIVIKR